MDTAHESICCKDINKIDSLLVGDPPPTCMTMHPEFSNACLSRAVHGMDTDTTTEPGMCLQMKIGKSCICIQKL